MEKMFGATALLVIILWGHPDCKAAQSAPVMQKPISCNVGISAARRLVYSVWTAAPQGISIKSAYYDKLRSAIYHAVETSVKDPGQATFALRATGDGGKAQLLGAAEPGAKPVQRVGAVVLDSDPKTLSRFAATSRSAIERALQQTAKDFPRGSTLVLNCTISVDGVFGPRHHTDTYKEIAVLGGDTATVFASPDASPMGGFTSENYGNACNFMASADAYKTAVTDARNPRTAGGHETEDDLRKALELQLAKLPPSMQAAARAQVEAQLAQRNLSMKMQKLHESGRDKEAAQIAQSARDEQLRRAAGFVPSKKSKELSLQQAEAALAKGDYSKALVAFKEAVKHSAFVDAQSPNTRIALLNRVLDCQYKTSNLSDAATTFEQIIGIMENSDPSGPALEATRRNYAMLLRKLGRDEDAQEQERKQPHP